MAPSSASASADIPLKEKYDVFLSFRGPDTRRTFTSHLKKALDDKKIDTYIDYDLERGEEIAPALLKAIERSKISVIVFSEKYASSRWCLDELVHILECREKYRQHVMPIFYNTVVSDIRHQSGSYELEERFKERTETERLKWKDALTKAADLSGFVSTSFRDDSDLIQHVVKSVDSIVMKLGFESPSYESGLVGVERRVQQIESLLCIDSRDDRVRSVVIWGMGGIGKTTLADAVFHRLSSQFDAFCFLPDVRARSGTQNGLQELRRILLRTLLGDKIPDIQSKTIDPSTAVKLSRKRVLVVLDDVDKSSQLEMLAERDVTFGSGSRIIITTRDKQRATEIELLRKGGNHDVEIYEVEKLNPDEARQFVKLNASAGFYSEVDSTNYLTNMVTYAAGCPLVLKLWNSLSRILSWDEMTKYLNEEMRSIYRVSYDVLRKNEKEIFLDIACFHRGKQINDVRGLLDCRGLFVDRGIEDLVRRSLIELRDNRFYPKKGDKYLWMHDVIQEMGQEIVREESPKKPGKRTRLYTCEDICHVLQNDSGTATIEIISPVHYLKMPTSLKLTPQVFGKMHHLTVLKLNGLDFPLKLPEGGLESLPNALRYLYWPYYSLATLPSKFSPSYLVELHMPHSQLQTVLNTDQKPQHLKKIDLSYSRELIDVPYLTACLESINLQGCDSLVRVPNLSESLNIVSINLQGCKKLVEVPSYFENLDKLTFLNLRGCRLLKCIPEMPSNMEFLHISNMEFLLWYSFNVEPMELSGLPSSIWSLKKLVELDLSGCYHIENLPSSIWMLNSLTSLDLSYTSLKELPSSIECLSRIVSIKLVNCVKLVSLPGSIGKLKSLKKLNLSYCDRLESLPTSIYKLKSLEELNLPGCFSLEFFPEILEPMECLKKLNLSDCHRLESLPTSIYKLKSLKKLDLLACDRLKSLPTSIYKLKSLEELNLSRCFSLEFFPEILEPMECLKKLNLSDCDRLESLPTSIYKLKSLEELNLPGCFSLEFFPEILEPMECLKKLDLLACDRLKNLPTRKLKSLEELNLSRCFSLEFFPEILEPMECLKKLDLSGCDRLKSLPTRIYKLKSLEELNLSGSSLEFFPESLEPMECLKKLDLSGCDRLKSLPTRIYKLKSLEELNLSGSSLEFFPESLEPMECLKKLDLSGCDRLKSLPTRIYKLKSLEELNLSGCSSLEFFPEILEPMECLKSLRLSYTKIEELDDSIENLVGLEVLDLSKCRSLKSVSNSIHKLRFLKDFEVANCWALEKHPISSSDILWSSLSNLDIRGCTRLEEIPDGLMNCFSLKKLNFSESKIKSIPTSIKGLSGLRFLYIWNCKNLESLPELPYYLEILDADGCRNLEMVSSSTTAVTKRLDQLCDEDSLTCGERYSFRSCKRLSETAKSNMMNDAELRIMRMAAAFFKWQETRDEYYGFRREGYYFAIVYPGNEIPERFRCQTAEGSSININLPVHPSRIWQLVLCAVLTVDEDEDEDEDENEPSRHIPDICDFHCKFNFTTTNGDCSEFDFDTPWSPRYTTCDKEKDTKWVDKSQGSIKMAENQNQSRLFQERGAAISKKLVEALQLLSWICFTTFTKCFDDEADNVTELVPDEADKWRQDQMTILCTVISQDTVQVAGKGDLLTDDTASAHLGSFYGSTQALSSGEALWTMCYFLLFVLLLHSQCFLIIKYEIFKLLKINT